jgi:DNA-binding MarR family transcriptional regulator
MSTVWSSAKVEGSELLVLLALADFADDEGTCWPSIETLARKSRLKRRATQYAIQSLVDAGLLTVEPNAGPNTVNLYRVTPGGAKRAPVHEDAPPPVHGGAPRTVKENRHSSLREADRNIQRYLAGTEHTFRPALQAWIDQEGGHSALVNAYQRFLGQETLTPNAHGRIGRLLRTHDAHAIGMAMWRMFRLGRPAGDPLDLLARGVAEARRERDDRTVAHASIRGEDPDA